MNSRQLTGVFYSFLSTLMWATVYVTVRYMMQGSEMGVDPVTLSLLRFGGGGLLLFLICLLTMRRKLFCLKGKDYIHVAILAAFSFVGMSVFLFWGQRYTTAINASMIMAASPLLTMIFGVFAGARISWRHAGGMAVCMLGCMMVIEVITRQGIRLSASGLSGDLLVLISSFSWAVSAIYAKRIITPENEFAVTVWSMLFATAMLLVIDICRFDSIVLPQTANTWWIIAYIAVFPTAVGFYAWNAALGRISLNVVNIMQYLTPVMTVLLAVAFLGERPGIFRLSGIVLVIFGVLMATLKRNSGSDVVSRNESCGIADKNG